MEQNLNKIARDKDTNALVVLDDDSLEQYKIRKKILRHKDKQIKSIESKLAQLEAKLDLLLKSTNLEE